MNDVEIIMTGEQIVQVDDGNGNAYPQTFSDQLLQKIFGKTKIRVKKSTSLNGYAFDYETIFKVSTDVIESLLDERISGVVLIYERETMSELAFYLSLFTRKYRKPIVLCPPPNKLYLVKGDKQQIGKQSSLQDLQQAIKIASNESYSRLPPITIHKGNIFLATYDTHYQLLKVKQLADNCWKYDEKSLPTNRYIDQYIGSIPVIPKKVALIKLSLGMNGQELLNIVKHYPGAVIEVNNCAKIHPSVLLAMKRLANYRIPILITSCKYQSLHKWTDSQSVLSQENFWYTGRLPSIHARLLLGVMISLNMPWSKMAEVCKKYR